MLVNIVSYLFSPFLFLFNKCVVEVIKFAVTFEECHEFFVGTVFLNLLAILGIQCMCVIDELR